MSTASDFLFPVPALPQSKLSPPHFPGVSPDSTNTLQNVLNDNHAKWHIFFNEKRFHNHAAHRAIASWSLGADASTIQSAYERDCGYEKTAFKSPEPINAVNFNDHLGDDKYFNSYVEFFTQYVKDKGIPAALEETIFSCKANLGSDSNKVALPQEKQPQMLSRFLSGVLHPMIHTGYGAEFDLPGMIIEGLAQTAVHFSSPNLLAPLSLFEDANPVVDMVVTAGEAIGSAFNKGVHVFDSALDKVLPKGMHAGPTSLRRNDTEDDQEIIPSKVTGTHALTILARVLRDPVFSPTSISTEDENDMFKNVIQNHGNALGAYINQWNVGGETTQTKIEELAWVVCVLYGVSGWTYGGAEYKKFNADFFFMHLVTSSIFLPALCALLTPASQTRLLKAYLMTALAWAVARGRPSLNIKGFVAEMQDPRSVSAPSSIPGWESAWMRMVEEAKAHHDEHVTKIIRSLAGWAGVFGTRRARVKLEPSGRRYDEDTRTVTGDEAECAGLGMGLGGPNEKTVDERAKPGPFDGDKNASHDKNYEKGGPKSTSDALNVAKDTPVSREDPNVLPRTELPGSEYLDGRLFLRVGILTLGRMGWDLVEKREEKKLQMKDSQREEEDFWDFQGFFAKRGEVTEIPKAKI